MDRNYGWKSEENFNMNEIETVYTETVHLYETDGKKAKKKSNLKTNLSLVLVSSILSSALTGWGLYSKFSGKLEEQAAIYQKAQTTSNIASYNISNIQYTKTALAKGSSVTEIAKKVGPSIIGIRMTTSNS